MTKVRVKLAMSKALEDVRVVDFTFHLMGPFTSLLLADMGADVIKIEPPWGDSSRQTKIEALNDFSISYLAANRNKRAIVLDLKKKKAVEIVKKLVEKSDIVIENYRPGTLDSMGLGYDTLKEVNPKIIFASLTGFGQYGPHSKRASFDQIAQATSGWMHLSSYGGTPTSVAGSPGDTITSTMGAVGILAALYQAKRTGKGQRVDVAQMDTLFSLVPVPMMSYFHDHKEPFGMNPNPEAIAEPPYSSIPFPIKRIRGTYPTKDGYIAISALLRYTDVFFQLIGADEPSVLEHWEKNKSISREIYPLIVDWIKNKTTNELMELFDENNMPAAPVNTFEMLENEPQFKERDMLFEYTHEGGFTYKAIGLPIKMSESSFEIYRSSPTLGQHTHEVLSTLVGLSDEEIETLRMEKVVA